MVLVLVAAEFGADSNSWLLEDLDSLSSVVEFAKGSGSLSSAVEFAEGSGSLFSIVEFSDSDVSGERSVSDEAVFEIASVVDKASVEVVSSADVSGVASAVLDAATG